MTKPIQIRMGGYGPSTTWFSQALKFIGDRITAAFGSDVDVKYVWNIMDFGYRADDILWLVESGVLTLGYQSSSYLTDRIPELGLVDLPFLFPDNATARAAIDGALGRYLAKQIEASTNYRILGFFENGFRHISNRLHDVRTPKDLAGMRIRVLPSKIQARTFELLGAVPLKLDLTEALAAIAAGTIDAQENPLANTVTYGVHKFHPFHTLTSHFYVSRPIFIHRTALRRLADGAATRHARGREGGDRRSSATFAVEEDRDARHAIEQQGCEIVELTLGQHAAFAAAVHAAARRGGRDLRPGGHAARDGN